MPLPTKDPVAFRGVPSLGAEKKMALSMTLTQKQVDAMFARQSTLRELGSTTSYPLEIDFDENKIYIGNIATPFNRVKEDGTREICQRSPTVSKPLAPISLSGNVIGKLNIHRDFDQDVADNVRKATEAEHTKRNERTIVVLDTPPAMSNNKKSRSASGASTLAKKAMSNRLVSAQATGNRLPNGVPTSRTSTPVTSSPTAGRPKPPTTTSKSAPSSRPLSATAKPSTPASSTAPSSSSTSKEPDLTTLRARITHLLALNPRTTREILEEVGGRSPSPETVREIEDNLTAVAQEIPPPKKGPSGPVKWELQLRSWEQVRPYEWPDLTNDQRTSMARKGRLALGQTSSADPLWEHFKFRVLDNSTVPPPGKGKAKSTSGPTLLKNSEFRGGMFPKEKKLSTKGGGVASGGVTKAKTSSSKSKAKKDQEDEVEDKVRRVLAADAKDKDKDKEKDKDKVKDKEKDKGSSVSSNAGTVPIPRIPKKKKQEDEVLPPSNKTGTSSRSVKRVSSPTPSKSHRVQDDGGQKRKLPDVDTDEASEMEEGEVLVEPDIKKRKLSGVEETAKSKVPALQSRNRDRPLKKSLNEKNKVPAKEESVPLNQPKDASTPRVSLVASSSKAVSAGNKAQGLDEREEETRDIERLKEREREKHRSNGKRGRRATPSFSSDEEEELKKPPTSARAPVAAAPKRKPSPHPPSSTIRPSASKVTASRAPAPSPALPSDKEALRRRYNTCYARYMKVTTKFHEQRAKVEALLATDTESVSADDDLEMMDTDALMQLCGEHELLQDELKRIQTAFTNAVF